MGNPLSRAPGGYVAARVAGIVPFPRLILIEDFVLGSIAPRCPSFALPNPHTNKLPVELPCLNVCPGGRRELESVDRGSNGGNVGVVHRGPEHRGKGSRLPWPIRTRLLPAE